VTPSASTPRTSRTAPRPTNRSNICRWSERRELRRRGVELRLGVSVKEVAGDRVTLGDGTTIRTRLVVWGGGEMAAPLASRSGLPQGRGGRIDVRPDLTVAGFPAVYALGDVANTPTGDGEALPQLGSAAQQAGRWAVAAGSTTEAYAALRLDVDNWRWSGVPFFVRTGKRLPATQTEIRLVFKRPPRLGLRLAGARTPEPDNLVVRLDPSTGIRFELDARRSDAPGPEPITLDMEFAQEGGEGPTPYEVLLHAAMAGNSTRFTRQDGVEETWRIMQPRVTAPPTVRP